MLIKTPSGLEYACHDWDHSFASHISMGDPVNNFVSGKEREIILNFLKNGKNRTFVDVGGHLGFWSLFMSKYFNKVLCFEPNPETFEYLKYNTLNNSNIELFNNALGDEECYVEVLYHIGYDTNPSINYSKEHWVNSGMSRVKKSSAGIKSIRLDSLNLDGVDFIKLDCEGYELMVLMGSENTIKKSYPIIVVETNGLEKKLYNIDTDEVDKYLIYLGYTKIFKPEDDLGVTSNSIYINKNLLT